MQEIATHFCLLVYIANYFHIIVLPVFLLVKALYFEKLPNYSIVLSIFFIRTIYFGKYYPIIAMKETLYSDDIAIIG